MKKKVAFTMTLLLAAGLLALPAVAQESSELLNRYEKVSQALVADDLAAAQKAAADLTSEAGAESALGKHASELSKSSSLETARNHFQMLSQEAISMAGDKSGYNVATCPMVQGDWLQKGDKIANPYMGRKMPDCGAMKKTSTAQNGGSAGCCSMTTRS